MQPPEKVLILIVDDEERNRKLLDVFMKSAGYGTILAASGREAAALAASARPTLILLDVMMPDMDGFELTRLLKGNPLTSGIPLVVVSSLDDIAFRQRMANAGADDVLNKPIDRWQLNECVSRMIKRRTENDE